MSVVPEVHKTCIYRTFICASTEPYLRHSFPFIWICIYLFVYPYLSYIYSMHNAGV